MLHARASLRCLALTVFACCAAACGSRSCPAPKTPTPAATPDAAPIQAAAQAVLDAQAAAWNRNDLDGFMAGYENSERMVFTSGGNVRRGYTTALERYRQAYPDLRKAGALSFVTEEITPLGADHALVLGRYHLEAAEPADGVFTLVLRRGADGWKIIHDHTSKSEPPAH